MKILTNLFDNSNSSDEIKIKNLYSLIRFSDENHLFVKNHVEIIYKWIENVNRKTAYPLSCLINELYNEKFELNIDKINIKSIDLMDEGGEYIKITTKSLNTIDIHFLVYNH